MFKDWKMKLSTILTVLMMLTLTPMTSLDPKVKAQGTIKVGDSLQYVIASKGDDNITFEGSTLNSKTIKDPKKEWTITLNEEIDPSSVALNNIYIADEQGNKISTTIPKLLTDQKSIVIKPTRDYEQKKTYYLYIMKQLQTVNGKNMKDNIRIPFVYIYNQKQLAGENPKEFTAEMAYEAKNNGVSSYFSRWGSTITSYLLNNNDKTISVIEANDVVTVETYDEQYNLIAKKSIEYELPLFDGFYSGEKYNYIAFGQANREENDNKEVIRIVRYDKSFKRIDSVSIKGGESYTVVPFDAACGRMAEHGNTLVFHTSRTRYTTEDGSNHQSQLTIIVNTSTMTVTNDMGRFQSNHVSHSFDQYVLFDDNTHVLIDHGDAYPRSIVLSKEKGTDYSEADLFEIPGKIGANCTGVSIGGFEKSSANYIVAMNTIDHSMVSEYTSYNMIGLEMDQRDIILCTLPKNNIDTTSVKQITLGKYVGSDKIASIPKLVKISDEKLMVMWQEYDTNNVRGDLKYVFIDKDGNATSKIQTINNFALSQCKPIIVKNKIVWYGNENGIRTFYTIPLN